jgi:hypothetical protein
MPFLKKDPKHVTLSCFSPEVMIATCIVETCLFLYVFWRYKIQPAQRIAAVLILCLAIFQLAEYNICESDPALRLAWTKFGLAAISLLPALGIHLTSLITKNSRLTWFSYAFAGVIIACFLFIPQATTGAFCTGNYIVIETHQGMGAVFGIYYCSFLALMILDASIALRSKKMKLGKKPRSVLYWMIGGYSAFIVPMIVAYLVSPSLSQGSPSIMCGFAVILAFVLTFAVLPGFEGLKKKKS